MTNSYHSFLRQETLNGHFANIGGIGDNFGIYAITAEQTANATTGQLVMNTATGNVAIGQTNPDANAKLTVNGDTKITGLAGTGERLVLADANGVLKTGVSVSNFATSNIYTADGTLTSNRKVTTGAHALTIDGTSYHPLQINANNGTGNGGLVIRPKGDTEKRVEMNTTPEGNLRLWAGRDVFYALRTNGNVGIGTNTPEQKLEAGGNIRALGGLMSSLATNTGGWLELENTLKTGDTEGARWRIYNMSDKISGQTGYTPGLHFWNYSQSATQPNLGSKMILTDDGNLGIGLGSRGVPTAKLEVNGNIIAKGLASNVNAYIGGDNAPAHANKTVPDVEIGSTKAGVRDISLYNPTDHVAMNLFAKDIRAYGILGSDALIGAGTRNVVADANGNLVIGETAVPIRTVTANTTLTAADNNGYVYVDAAGATTITIPATLPAGFSCIIVQQGAGQVTIAGSGVTLQTARGTKTRTRYSAVGIIKRTTNTATITGDAVN